MGVEYHSAPLAVSLLAAFSAVLLAMATYGGVRGAAKDVLGEK